MRSPSMRLDRRVMWALLFPSAVVFSVNASALTQAQERAGVLRGDLVPAIDPRLLDTFAYPARQRDSKRFWLTAPVFQKNGIVIEDEDYIVRTKYYVLDSRAVGEVVDVRDTDEGAVCTVRFQDRSLWQVNELNKKPVSQTEAQTTMKVTRDGLDAETIATTYRIEGYAVSSSKCGVIKKQENEGTLLVEFPASLLSYELPRMGDKVVRGPDWQDGYVDGNDHPIGRPDKTVADYYGLVVENRNAEGYIHVKWAVTNRVTVHRFDNNGGFVDIQKLPTPPAVKKKQDGDGEAQPPDADQKT
jgi:hypothetical protein